MSFGYYDKDWIDPPEPDEYHRACKYCEKFVPCACGCGYGHCKDDPDESFDGDNDGCECGIPVDGLYQEPADEDYLYDVWKDRQFGL